MFCDNMDKLQELKERCKNYDMMDALTITEYCGRMAAHPENKRGGT